MRKNGKWHSWIFYPPAIVLILIFTLPILAIVFGALSSIMASSLINEASLAAIQVSLMTTGLSTFLTIVLGTPLAYLMSIWSFRGKLFIELMADLPIVLPPSLAGVGLLLVFGRQGWLGGAFEIIGINISFSMAAVVLAQLFVASPLFIRSARIGFLSVDDSLKEAALVEGPSNWQMFWLVMVPLSKQALLSGVLLSSARALGEFGATILFAGNLTGITQTMPLAIYIGLESNRGIAIGLSFILLLLAASFLLIMRRIEKSWRLR